ncbi:arrestin domain-containing protein 3-like [Amphiura filiformis]|uniref:arrestin domain-containing protein 3-like n=1 Tax=Amphiura filiformis TaxID=82378 RepID=UPI003B21BC3D
MRDDRKIVGRREEKREERKDTYKDEIEKRICCLCCESGPIRVSAETDKCGYVPGEDIWVTGSVDNQTRLAIVSCSAKLMQLVSYRARRKGVGKEHVKKEKRKIASVEGEGCDGVSTLTFEGKPIIVPACPASGLVGCSILDIEYYVEFEADVRGTPFDAIVKIPIAIGHVPLSSAFSPVTDNARVITKQPSSINLTIPPSYEVAVGGLQEIPSKSGYDYTFGKLMYAPRYPYYNFHLESDVVEHPGHEVPQGFYGPFGPSMFGPDPHHYP